MQLRGVRAAEQSRPSISTEHRRFGGNAVDKIPNLPHLKVRAWTSYFLEYGDHSFSEYYHNDPCQVDTSTSISAFDSWLGSEVTLWGAMRHRHGAILSFHQCSFINESSSSLALDLNLELSGRFSSKKCVQNEGPKVTSS